MSLDDTEIPLPGHFLRPGIPAPANARLSLGLGLGVPSTPTRQSQPTTTIRLISNFFPNTNACYGAGENGTPQLQPFKTSFNLVPPSPTPGVSGSMSTWPPSPGAFDFEEEEEQEQKKSQQKTRLEREKNGTPQLQPVKTSFNLVPPSLTPGVSGSMSTWPPSPGAFSFEEDEDQEQKKSQQKIRLERENEAIRKKLEANRARRRSSAVHGGFHGRKSGRISAGRISLLGKAVFFFVRYMALTTLTCTIR
jgi:hypothetical protein